MVKTRKSELEGELTNGNSLSPHTRTGPFESGRSQNNPDPELGQAISNLPDPRAESCRYLAPGKAIDCSILRPEAQDSPRTVSTRETPLRKISKYFDPSDTRLLIGAGSGSCRGIDSTLASLSECYDCHRI